MKRGRKAQVGVEVMLFVGIALLALTILLTYSYRQSSSTITIEQAADAVNTLAKTADSVYALGPGTEQYVYITTPGNIAGTSVSGRSVLMQIHVFGKVSDIHAVSKANLTGDIPDSRGTYRIKVKTLDSGIVEFEIT